MDNASENNRKQLGNRIKSSNNQINELGRIPPQAIDLEQAVLGAMMLEKNAVTAVIDRLKPHLNFSVHPNQSISLLSQIR
jgi:replicative DNA helicase